MSPEVLGPVTPGVSAGNGLGPVIYLGLESPWEQNHGN